jgi:hypothetical protein
LSEDATQAKVPEAPAIQRCHSHPMDNLFRFLAIKIAAGQKGRDFFLPKSPCANVQ